ncbi:hypothetical protein SLA2020_426810 [Shorea laevis]
MEASGTYKKRSAWTDCAWMIKNCSRGSANSHSLRKTNFSKSLSPWNLNTGRWFKDQDLWKRLGIVTMAFFSTIHG